MKFTKAIEHNPTPEELATAFWDMDATGQAKFFNELGEILNRVGFNFSTQLQWVTDNKRLNRLGRDAMAKIGEYAEPTK